MSKEMEDRSEELEESIDDSEAYAEAEEFELCEHCGSDLFDGECPVCDVEYEPEDEKEEGDEHSILDNCEECGEALNANGQCWRCDEDFEELDDEITDEDESYD